MRRHLLAPLSAVLAAVALLAGACGSGEDPAAIVRAAATRTVDADSSRMAMTVEMAGGPQTGTITAEGAFDYASRRGRLTVDVGGIPGAGQFGGTMEAITDDLAIYMKFPPALASQIPGGKPWLKIDLQAAGAQAGIDFSQLASVSQGDPTQALQHLKGASDDVTEVGEETIRGAKTTHYRATVDLRKAAEQLEGEQREAYEKVIDMLGTTTMPTDVWIDEDGRARKMSYTQDLSKAKINGRPAGTGTMKMSIELFDFGVEVDAEPPPADQVLDLGALLQQQ